MKRTARFLTIFTLIAVLALAALPAFAQDSTTTSHEVTITEEQVNASYRVTNPRRAAVTNVYVDLQPGQVVVSETVTFRGHDPIQTVSVLVPTIANNRLNWSVTSVTHDGQPIPDDLLAQINASVATSWVRYIKNHAPAGHIQDIVITDYEVVLTLARPARSANTGS